MQRLIINTVFTRGASTFLNFLIALLIARHAGPAVKGDVTLLITTIWFFIFLSNILGGQALVYLIPRNKIELLVVPAYLWSVLIAVAGFIFLKSVHVINVKHIPAITVLGLLSAITGIHQTILLARRQIINANLVMLIPLLFQFAGILFCFYFLKINDAYAYIYASLVAYAIASAASFLMVRKLIRFSDFVKDFSLAEMKISFRYGLLYQLVEVLQLLNLRYYFYQLGLQEGSRYLGVYSIGISILESVWIIPRSIATVHYVSTSHSTEIKRESLHTMQLMKISLLLCLFALLVIALIPADAYTFVFGPGFKDVKYSMRFLLPGILIYSLPIVMSSFYSGIGKYLPLVISNFMGFMVLLIFSHILIPQYVMSGAGLAASISFAVASCILFAYFMFDNKLPVKTLAFAKEDWNFLKTLVLQYRK